MIGAVKHAMLGQVSFVLMNYANHMLLGLESQFDKEKIQIMSVADQA